jgi:hypothetical protein
MIVGLATFLSPNRGPESFHNVFNVRTEIKLILTDLSDYMGGGTFDTFVFIESQHFVLFAQLLQIQ